MVVDAYSVLEVVANNKSARRRETRGADLGPKGCMYDNVSSFDFNAWYEVSLMMTEIGRNGERGREKERRERCVCCISVVQLRDEKKKKRKIRRIVFI